jgi:hypothetical protein
MNKLAKLFHKLFYLAIDLEPDNHNNVIQIPISVEEVQPPKEPKKKIVKVTTHSLRENSRQHSSAIQAELQVFFTSLPKQITRVSQKSHNLIYEYTRFKIFPGKPFTFWGTYFFSGNIHIKNKYHSMDELDKTLEIPALLFTERNPEQSLSQVLQEYLLNQSIDSLLKTSSPELHYLYQIFFSEEQRPTIQPVEYIGIFQKLDRIIKQISTNLSFLEQILFIFMRDKNGDKIQDHVQFDFSNLLKSEKTKEKKISDSSQMKKIDTRIESLLQKKKAEENNLKQTSSLYPILYIEFEIYKATILKRSLSYRQ